MVGWGSTFGAIRSATENLRNEGYKVSQIHLRHLNPLPNDLEKIMRSFKNVAVPELNLGQLSMIIRSKYLIDAKGINQVNTKPFAVSDLVDEAKKILGEG